MRIVGIIAEYNPFHQGHAYQIKKVRELTQADFILVSMSGNFVQRGAPAMFDKYTRAHAALLSGADLVLELPVSIATGSAEAFARGGVRLLHDTGIVTDLCFGSECGDLSSLERLASFLAEEPTDYKLHLQDGLKQGLSFPAAREQAVRFSDPSLPAELLGMPNNLLGLEYLKALHLYESSIRPFTIQREGSGYHDTDVSSGQYSSASAIRAELIRSGGHFSEELLAQLPHPELYISYADHPPVTEDAFSLLLLEKLRRLSLTDEPLSQYEGISEDLANRISGALDQFTGFSAFTDLMKTRNQTRTAISRALLHILLDIQAPQPACMFRVLGFRKDSRAVLTALSEQGTLPVVTSLTRSPLDRTSLYPDQLYESVRSILQQTPYQNEFRRKMLVV